MAVDTDAQAQYIRDVENLRQNVRAATVSIRTNTEGNVRNVLTQKALLDVKIAEDDFEGAYGDGSPSTVAADVNAEIADALGVVDAVIGVTDKTRAEIEAEVVPRQSPGI